MIKRLRSPHLKFCLLAWAAWLCVCLSPRLAAYLPVARAAGQSVSQAESRPPEESPEQPSLEQQGKSLYEAGRFTEAAAVLQQVVLTYEQ